MTNFILQNTKGPTRPTGRKHVSLQLCARAPDTGQNGLMDKMLDSVITVSLFCVYFFHQTAVFPVVAMESPPDVTG